VHLSDHDCTFTATSADKNTFLGKHDLMQDISTDKATVLYGILKYFKHLFKPCKDVEFTPTPVFVYSSKSGGNGRKGSCLYRTVFCQWFFKRRFTEKIIANT
jgi:hypothetical protein